MKRILIAVALLLSFHSIASAQAVVCNTSPCVVQLNKPFTAMADHDGVDTSIYRLYVNGQKVQEQPVTILANGVITFPPMSLTAKGDFIIYVEAVGDGGATSGSTLTLTVQPGKPKAPVNTRVSQGS